MSFSGSSFYWWKIQWKYTFDTSADSVKTSKHGFELSPHGCRDGDGEGEIDWEGVDWVDVEGVREGEVVWKGEGVDWVDIEAVDSNNIEGEIEEDWVGIKGEDEIIFFVETIWIIKLLSFSTSSLDSFIRVSECIVSVDTWLLLSIWTFSSIDSTLNGIIVGINLFIEWWTSFSLIFPVTI